jgi:hypothetical protein
MVWGGEEVEGCSAVKTRERCCGIVLRCARACRRWCYVITINAAGKLMCSAGIVMRGGCQARMGGGR